MRVEVLLVAVFRAEQQRDAVMGPGDDDGDFRAEPDHAVAAQAVAEQRRIIGPVLDIARPLQRLLHLAAQPVRLIVQALRHQDDIHDVLRPGRAEVRLPLHDLAGDQLQAFRIAAMSESWMLLRTDHWFCRTSIMAAIFSGRASRGMSCEGEAM